MKISEVTKSVVGPVATAAVLGVASAAWYLWNEVDDHQDRLSALEGKITTLDEKTIPGMKSEYEGFQASLTRSHFEQSEENDKLCKTARQYISYLYEAVASLELIEEHFQKEMTRSQGSQGAGLPQEYLAAHRVHLAKASRAVDRIRELQGNAVILMENVCEARARGATPRGTSASTNR
jgi:hypothetical protein